MVRLFASLLVLVLCWPVSGWAQTVTTVSTNSGNSTSATPTATFSPAATAGNLLLIGVASDDYNSTPPTGFTETTNCAQDTGSPFHGHYVWWKIATGGETGIGYSIGSAVISVWTTVELNSSTGFLSPYIDGCQGQFTNSGATTYTTPNITPTAGERYLVGSITAQNSAGATYTLSTWLNSFTELVEVTAASGAGETQGFAGLRVTANGSTAYSTGATYSAGTSNSRGGIIAAFQLNPEGGGGGGCRGALLLLGVGGC